MKKILKKLAIGFVIVMAILAGGILVIPGFLNWNKYQRQIEQTASYYSGRKVTIKGNISLSLLPTSALSAKNVTIANLNNGRAPYLLSLKSLDIRVSFLSVISSLFGGKIKIEKLILVDPVVALEVLKDGRKNWILTKTSGPSRAASADISLDKFQIVNGQISFENMATGHRELFRKINANVTAKSIIGPLRVSGRAKYRGVVAEISLNLGKNRPGKKIPVTVKIAVINGRVKATAIGGVILRGKNPAFSGKLKLTAGDIGDFFDVVDRVKGRKSSGGIKFGQDFALDSRIDAGINNITARNLVIRMGHSRGQGRGEISLGRKIKFLVDLTINKFDMDKILTALSGPAQGAFRSVDNIIGGGIGRGLKTHWLRRLSGRMNIKLGAVKYNGKIASRIAVKLVAKDAVVDIATLQARMPGGAVLSFTGKITETAARKPKLTGAISLGASNLRGLLSWLKLDVKNIPAGQLTQFSYKSRLNMTPDILQFYGARGNLDALSFTGGLSYAFKGRPSYGISLDIRNLNLDTYMQPDGGGNNDKPMRAGDFSHKLAVLDKFDARYKIALSNFTVHGLRLRSGELDGLLLGGKLSARVITLTDVAGINLVASGQGKNFGTKPEIIIKLSAHAKSLENLRRTLELEKIIEPGRLGTLTLGPMRMTGTLAATFEKMQVNIKSRLGPSNFDVKGVFRPAASKQFPDVSRADLEVKVSSSSLSALIAQVDLPLVRPAALDDHPLSITGHFKVGPNSVDGEGKIDITTGVITVTGYRQIRGQIQAQAASVAMTVDVQGRQTREFIRGLGIDFQPATRKLGPIGIQFKLTGTQDKYTLSNIIGTFGPVKLSGSGKVDLGSSIPYFEVNLKAGDIPLDDFLKNNDLKPSGSVSRKYGQWNRQPMDLSLLSAYNGRVEMSADSLRYNDYIVEKPVFEALLKGGNLAINNLTGRLFGGALVLSAKLNSGQKNLPEIAVAISVKKAALSEATKSLAGGAPISGPVDLTSKFTGEGISQYDIISSLSGQGKITTGPGMITNIDIPSLSKKLADMNSNKAFANLLLAALSGGKTSYKGSMSDFIIKNGRVNFSPFAIALEGARSMVKMNLDLLKWTIHSEGSLFLVDHPDAPPIGVLIAGNISAPDVRYRTDRLKKYLGAKIASRMLLKLVGGKSRLEGMFGKGPLPKQADPGAVHPKKTIPNPGAAGRNKKISLSKQQPKALPKFGDEFGKRLLQKLFNNKNKSSKGDTKNKSGKSGTKDKSGKSGTKDKSGKGGTKDKSGKGDTS